MDRIFTVAILATGLLAGAAGLQADDPPQPGLIFSGTVEKVGDVSFEGVPKSDHTIVVTVDRVLLKPDAVSLAKGQRVTVDAVDPAVLPVGSRFTFFAQGWIYGKGVAVRELRHEAATTATPTAGVPRLALSDSQLKERLTAADIVITGRVSQVRPARRPMLAGVRTRISEHEPNWQEAFVHVETSLKGAAGVQDIVVRFPGSWDVAWAQAPKLRQGQNGTFILKKDDVSKIPAQPTNTPNSVVPHVALNPADVLPVSEQARIRELLRAQ